MPDTNGSQSEAPGRARPYVVLEEGSLLDHVRTLLENADVGLGIEEWERINSQPSRTIFSELARVPARNSAHALTQVASRYGAGATPPLAAVSERMFQPRRVNVSFDPRVSLA